VAQDQLNLTHTPGGIPVIVERLPYFRSVALSVNVGVGSRDEPQDHCGIAHLLEHLMFKGTSERSTKEISELIEGAGGELNGYTTKELTSFHVFSLDETAETAQSILSDMIVNPLIDEEHVELERSVVTQEINMMVDEPEDYSRVLLDQSIWRGHPMATPESGEIESVKGIETADLRGFFSDNYRPPNLTVVACGHVDKRQVLKWASTSFDHLEVAKKNPARIPPVTRSSINVFPREGDQAYVEMGFPGLDAKHPDRQAAWLACGVIGAGTSSRLYQRVREDEGLVYTIFTFPQMFSDCGLIETHFSTESEKAETVIRHIAEELKRMKDEGLVEGELERAKRWVKGTLVRKLENTESRMYWLGEHYMMTGEVMPLGKILEEFDKVTAEDVVRVSNELFKRNKLCVVLHAPETQGKQIAKNIKTLDF
jgi:predicted Zn-dependent peptidase